MYKALYHHAAMVSGKNVRLFIASNRIEVQFEVGICLSIYTTISHPVKNFSGHQSEKSFSEVKLSAFFWV